jgi:hypothetical protein
MAPQTFERLRFCCKACGTPNLIRSASVNLTYVILEGFCHVCLRLSSMTVDLLRLDEALRADDDNHPRDYLILETSAEPPAPARGITGRCHCNGLCLECPLYRKRSAASCA